MAGLRATMMVMAAGVAVAALSGCTSKVRQDPYLTPNSTSSTMLDDVPIYRDRPLAEALTGTLVFADYVRLLEDAKLLGVLRGARPYTVLAITNTGIESVPADRLDRVRQPAFTPALRRYLGYTIIEGDWNRDRLWQAVKKHGGTLVLPTFYRDDAITVTIDPRTNRFLFTDGAGVTQPAVIDSVRTSNGTLYGLDQPIRAATR